MKTKITKKEFKDSIENLYTLLEYLINNGNEFEKILENEYLTLKKQALEKTGVDPKTLKLQMAAAKHALKVDRENSFASTLTGLTYWQVKDILSKNRKK